MKLLDFFQQDKELVEDLQREPLAPGALFERQVMPLLKASDYGNEEIAEALGMSRQSLHRFCKGEMTVAADLAAKLAFLSGTSTQSWLNLQRIYDLYKVKDVEITSQLRKASVAYATERARLSGSLVSSGLS